MPSLSTNDNILEKVYTNKYDLYISKTQSIFYILRKSDGENNNTQRQWKNYANCFILYTISCFQTRKDVSISFFPHQTIDEKSL